MKKVLCPYCNRLNLVDEQEEIIYCKECSKAFNLKQGENLFSIFEIRYLNKANNELYVATNYPNAEKFYLKLLELDNTYLEGIIGVLLSKLYQSQLFSSTLKDVNKLLKAYGSGFNFSDNNLKLIDEFLIRMMNGLNTFGSAILCHLRNAEQKFYNENCLKFYLDFLQDTLTIVETLKEIFNDEQILNFLKEKHISFEEKILAIKTKLMENYPLAYPPIYEINDIKTQIFADNRRLYKMRNIAIICLIISLLIVILGVILIFALSDKLLIGVPIMGAGVLLTIVCYILNIVFKRKLFKELL